MCGWQGFQAEAAQRRKRTDGCVGAGGQGEEGGVFLSRVQIMAFFKKKKKYIFKYLFLYLAVLGFSYDTMDLQFSLWHARSLVPACEFLVLACGI